MDTSWITQAGIGKGREAGAGAQQSPEHLTGACQPCEVGCLGEQGGNNKQLLPRSAPAARRRLLRCGKLQLSAIQAAAQQRRGAQGSSPGACARRPATPALLLPVAGAGAGALLMCRLEAWRGTRQLSRGCRYLQAAPRQGQSSTKMHQMQAEAGKGSCSGLADGRASRTLPCLRSCLSSWRSTDRKL